MEANQLMTFGDTRRLILDTIVSLRDGNMDVNRGMAIAANMKVISQLLSIGEKAVDHQRHQRAVSNAKADLHAAYAKWKDDHGIDRVERETNDWAEMMSDTKPQFQAYRKALASQNNAKQRLKRAAMAYLLADPSQT
jgi:hypothetical protein